MKFSVQITLLRASIGILLSIGFIVPVTASPLLLSEERLASVTEKYQQDSADWRYMMRRVNGSINKTPYGSGGFAAASALAFKLTGDDVYFDNALRLYENAYQADPSVGWPKYTSRNNFRTGARWALITYNWLKPNVPSAKQAQFEQNFATWADYWLNYTDYKNDFKRLRIRDTDDITSLAENLLLLGLVLSQSQQHSELGHETLLVADRLLNELVIARYMDDIMAGGVWAEGNDYGPQTQIHWLLAFLINKEHRNIPVPNDYALASAKALRHLTLAGFTDVYRYGSEEKVRDYDSLGADGRYSYVLTIQALLDEQQNALWIKPWWDSFVESEGHPDSSIHTGLWRVLFEPLENEVEAAEVVLPEATSHFAPGVGLFSTRSGWEEDSTNFYMINRRVRVDHEHRDALSIDIAYKGRWVSKEVSGYSGISAYSLAHNTLLIENADKGSSNPTGRASGSPYYHSVYDDEQISIASAEASPAYNMSGYFATDYVEQVTRQVIFIKPNIFAIYDRVITDPTQYRDLARYKDDFVIPEDGSYVREVTLVQHLEKEPIESLMQANQFSYETENAEIEYGIAYPESAVTERIDEAELWDGVPDYQAPVSQRKWMVQTRLAERSQNTEFISYFTIKDNQPICNRQIKRNCIYPFAKAPSTAEYKVDVLSADNASILRGDAMGVQFTPNTGEAHIAIWNRTPEVPMDAVEVEVARNNNQWLFTGLKSEYCYDLTSRSVESRTLVQLEAFEPLSEQIVTNERLACTNEEGILKLTY